MIAPPPDRLPLVPGVSLGSSSALTRFYAWGGGLLFTVLLFTGIGLVQRQESESTASDTQLLADVSLPLPPPPPPPVREFESKPREDFNIDPIGFQMARTDSAVRIAATPPPLDSAHPDVPPPTAYVASNMSTVAVKPSIKAESVDLNRVYTSREVDQPIIVLHRRRPDVRAWKFDHLKNPRMNVFFIVDAKGNIGDIRILKSSGDAELDREILAALKFWEFAPARKGGKAVRQSVEQLFNIDVGRGDPFSTSN